MTTKRGPMAMTAILGLTTALAIGCTTAASPSAGDASVSPPSVAASAASDGPVPSAAVSAAASAPSPSAAASAGSGGAAGTYDCAALLSDAEIRQATGVPDFALAPDNTSGGPEGYTDCGYFGKGGTLYIQLTTWTGPSKVTFDGSWEGLAPLGEPIAGVGDEAAFAQEGTRATGAAKAGPVGISVAFQEGAPAAFEGVDVKAAATEILRTVVGRV
jgi:hypothetical protein